VVITAAGGISIYNINMPDPEAGYFVTWMGNNANSTYGFTKVTISASQLLAQFIGAAGGTFSDSFSIVSGSSTPTPTATATPTATSQPASAITLRSVSTANNASGATSLTINAPAGITNGDVLVAQVTVRGATTTITPPSGWSLIRRDNTTGSMGVALYYKVVAGTQSTSFGWTFNSQRQASGGIAAYAGVDNATPIDASSGRYNDSTATITASSVTATVPNDRLVFFASVTTNASVTFPSGMTRQWNVSTSDTTSAMADQPLSSAGATGDRVATSGVNNSNIAQLVALKPAATGNPTPTPTFTPIATVRLVQSPLTNEEK
jgi:hypothetical protein